VLNLASHVLEFATSGERNGHEFILLSEHGGSRQVIGRVRVETGQAVDRRPVRHGAGGGRTTTHRAAAALTAFLQRSSRTARRMASTCTGAFNLARGPAGRPGRATTHWFYAAQNSGGPSGRETGGRPDLIIDGRCDIAGMTACIDSHSHWSEKDVGMRSPAGGEKLIVYTAARAGQSQFSECLAWSRASTAIRRRWLMRSASAHRVVGRALRTRDLSPRQSARIPRRDGSITGKPSNICASEAARLMLESGRHPIDRHRARDRLWGRERMRRAFLARLRTTAASDPRTLRGDDRR